MSEVELETAKAIILAGKLDEIPDLLEGMDEQGARLLLAELQQLQTKLRQSTWEPYPWQVPPGEIPTHGTWLMLGGRGTGKTEAGSRYVDAHVNGPACDPRLRGGHRVAIVGPTIGDAVEACYSGPSGIQTVNPTTRLRGGTGGTSVIWANGARARIFGSHSAEDVERLRAGGNNCLVWLEEAAAMRHLTAVIQHASFGLRIGTRPHFIASTTPKARREIRAMVTDPMVQVTTGRTRDAVRLDASVRDHFIKMYEGTRIGRQELDAEILSDVEGALWTYDLITASVVREEELPPLARVIVAVDPQGTHKAPDAETGIIVVGVAVVAGTRHAYVLADYSGDYTPDGWASKAIEAYQLHQASSIVAEKNFGGDMVKTTIRTAIQRDPNADPVPVKVIHATRGKAIRAEPVVMLYEQKRVHHVLTPGLLEKLEEQQTTWVPAESDWSPDRLDALVHGVSELLLSGGLAAASSPSKLPPVQGSWRGRSPTGGASPTGRGSAGGRPNFGGMPRVTSSSNGSANGSNGRRPA